VIGIFKNNNPLALLLLALLAFLPGITGDTMVNATVPAGATAIFKELFAYLSFLDGSKGMLGKTIYTSVLLTEALLLNKIISDHKLMERAGFIPAMSFLLLNTLLPLHTSPVFLVLNGIILLVLKWMIVMYKQNNASNQLLLTGFVVGCLVLMNTTFSDSLWMDHHRCHDHETSFPEGVVAFNNRFYPALLFHGLRVISF